MLKRILYKYAVLFLAIIVILAFFWIRYAKSQEEAQPEPPAKQIKESELNKILEEMPKVSRTGGGKDSDPINLVLIAPYKDLAGAFKEAGWEMAAETNAKSAIRMTYSVVRAGSYKKAPVSSLYVFDRPEDFAFQKPRWSARRRHHIRFWKAPYAIGDADIWLAAGTHDVGVKFSRKTKMLLTHKIDPDIDDERDFIVEEMLDTNRVKRYWKERGIYPRTEGMNSTGDKYFTDGDTYVLELKEVGTDEAKYHEEYNYGGKDAES